ncbi:MAG: ATP-binding cassette domain-containing protein [Rikenellaceae bacterium]|nr:ATP-binding cassette domain-containing protein [Rikenellaceae bacterium]
MSNIITAEHITKRFSAHTALDDVSVEIPRGSVYGLLGPNGAGKTTLIRTINRITLPDEGQIFFDGKPITQQDIFRIGYLPEERGLYRKMKVGEQALFLAKLKGLSHHDALVRLKEWFTRLEIEDWWNKKVEDLSKGMAQKVQFIVTVLHRPELLIFDEPFSGFDPINANLLKEEILRLRDEGATVIFSTHNMASVEEICDHITLINKSHNILSGRVDDIRQAHGGNIFSVQYKGDDKALVERIGGVCEIIAQEESTTGYSSLKVHIERNEDVRSVVALINDTVEMRQFTETIPSMNDIFIRAVNGTL